MPDLQFDVAVANRFISSLSKSLQALCHGCMDFDSGIEIVGYINVNIDCGSKVDYVLNEKVSKSTNNSMTFVSNSFLAKKDQPKQTRDGACSPIHHLGSQPHAAPPYHRVRGFSHSSWTRSGYHGAHYHRGAQKRGFGGEWRGAAKRPRPLPSDFSSTAQFSSPASTQGLPSETYNSGNFRHQYPQHSGTADSHQTSESENSAVNIKKEAFEESDETQAHSESSGQQVDSVNIKSDPDGNPVTGGEDTTNTKTETSETNDFKGTFLQPTSQDNQESSDKGQTSESGDQMSMKDQPVSFETPFPNPDSPSAAGDDETSNNTHETFESNTNIGGDESEAKDDNSAAVEYDTATEETSYSEYPDGGEGTSSGQFEVIEIDDEDEDMQAMFGASHPMPPFPIHLHRAGHTLVEHSPFKTQYESPEQGIATSQQGRSEMNTRPSCPVCDKKFSRTYDVKRHLRSVHGSCQCPKCSLIFKAGQDYNRHLVYCQ